MHVMHALAKRSRRAKFGKGLMVLIRHQSGRLAIFSFNTRERAESFAGRAGSAFRRFL